MRKRRHSVSRPARYRGRSGGRRGEKALLALGGVFVLLAAVCGFALRGVKFSAALFLGLAAACAALAALNRWAAVSRSGAALRGVLAALLCAGIFLFVLTEGRIAAAGESTAYKTRRPDAIVVLGAGVNGSTPSLALQSRIDAAADYLDRHPDVPVILSGGQGPDEDVSEALAMYRGLVGLHADPGRLYLEERSATTAENFCNTAELLRSLGLKPGKTELAVVTNDFHIYRALKIADSQGMPSAFGVPAELPWWWLRANYYVREFFAVGKSVLVRA
ncbi:MAG: YdcF family protein [Oscillibacter sp.]|nr:YdcF family protein [Oscillibacter sp.]